MRVTNIIALIVCLAIGISIRQANPKRAVNRAFFLLSLILAALVLAVIRLTVPDPPDPVFWLRVTNAIGGFIAWAFVLVINATLGRGGLMKSIRWLCFAVALAGLTATDFFIPAGSTREHQLRGFGWDVYAVSLGAAFVIIFSQSALELKNVQGIKKDELRILLFGTALGFLSTGLSAIGPILGIPLLPRLIPALVVGFYSFIAWGITTRKVFDARHLFRSGAQKLVSVGAIAAIIGVSLEVSESHVPRGVVVLFCAVVITFVFERFNRSVTETMQMGNERDADAVQSVIIAAGRDEFDHATLVGRYSKILAHWAGSDNAYFLIGERDAYCFGPVRMPVKSPAVVELLQSKWATPESLQRQRADKGRNELAAFMDDHGLGVLLCGPAEGGLPSFLVALDYRRDRTPFTWSDINLLQGWATVIEANLSKISLTAQARQFEQLRTAGLLGASLAHEIRNPLVTLKTIAQSAKTSFSDPEFRRLLIELVPAEIERIEGLVNGLMDLGRPQHSHFERLHLNEVVETSVKLVRPKAQDEAVELGCVLDAQPDEINGDRGSIRQVILNLVMNAIQAVSPMDGRREVTVRTGGDAGSLVLEVADNGPGIPKEVREHLFQPFTTSNKTSGIGLGLAITADLVKMHHGQITLVDGAGPGTTFRVTLPCQQPSY